MNEKKCWNIEHLEDAILHIARGTHGNPLADRAVAIAKTMRFDGYWNARGYVEARQWSEYYRSSMTRLMWKSLYRALRSKKGSCYHITGYEWDMVAMAKYCRGYRHRVMKHEPC